jgi:hypothetical protein
MSYFIIGGTNVAVGQKSGGRNVGGRNVCGTYVCRTKVAPPKKLNMIKKIKTKSSVGCDRQEEMGNKEKNNNSERNFLINPFIDAQLFSNSFQGSSCCCEKIEGRGQGYFCVLLNFYDQIF